MNDGWIHISEVFAAMEKGAEDGEPFIFSIAFVRDNRSKNGPRGSIKKVDRAIKGVQTSKGKKTGGSKVTLDKWQFKSFQGIPIIDLSIDRTITPKFTHIIEFNGKKVRHFGK